MTTHPHPTIPERAVPIIVGTHPPGGIRRAAALTRGSTAPDTGRPNDAPAEPTPNGAAYIARLDRIMRIS